MKYFLFLLLIIMGCSQADSSIYSWGGKGYDHEGSLQSRFTARMPCCSHLKEVKEKNLIIIDFDGEESYTYGLKNIELLAKDGTKVSSNRCWLSQHHIDAPYACSFPIKEVSRLSSKGSIVINLNNNTSLKEDIDFDKLNIFIKNNRIF